MERIPLANGRGFALVDDADVPLVNGYHWRLMVKSNLRYALGWAGSKPNGSRRGLLMHVLIMGQPGIDHIDSDGLNNQRSNLRPATQGQNMGNSRPRTGCSSRYKGVCWHKRIGRWQAELREGGRRHNLGYFTDEEDAARAYDTLALTVWGEYARLNLPRLR